MANRQNKGNVFFIMLDQLNYRCLGFMNHPDVRTPNIDGLAKDGVNEVETFLHRDELKVTIMLVVIGAKQCVRIGL